MEELVQNVIATLDESIDELAWMSPETRLKSKEKLSKFNAKIGYPNEWRDYSALEIVAGDNVGNIRRAAEWEHERELAKLGTPVDNKEWVMNPQTVNAYYDPSKNEIVFPAARLQPPFFQLDADDAINYGAVGGVIGHEISHGFDDSGSQYDGDGNLRDWWTEEDVTSFEEGAQCIRDQYSGYRVIDDIFINSDLTAGEDIADLGGVVLAWHAWKKETEDQELQTMDGLTPEQRFFVGFAQWACTSERPESLRLHAANDPHSPPRYRINGVTVNMPEFGKAFSCDADAAMVKREEDVCKIW